MLASVVNWSFHLTWKERMHFAKRGLAWKASVNDTVMKINSFTAGHEEPGDHAWCQECSLAFGCSPCLAWGK